MVCPLGYGVEGPYPLDLRLVEANWVAYDEKLDSALVRNLPELVR